MKKAVCILFAIIVLFAGINITAFAQGAEIAIQGPSLFLLRAGGGGSGGGSGGSGGGGSSGGHTGTHAGGNSSPFEMILMFIVYPFIFCFSAIAFYYRLSKRSRKAKKLMKQMMKSDSAWKFKHIEATVQESFYTIQTAWSNLDMSPAAQYMSDQLRESFQTKLNWMEFRHEKNILQDIKLLKALPVAVYDDADNTRDHVWFYIHGKMVDYIIDTQTGAKRSGSTTPGRFVEYWQFIRKEDRWVLHKILQKDESDQIVFSE